MNQSRNIAQKSISSVKWSTLTEIVSRAIFPITFVILARILTPEDYGLVAIAQVTISFCKLFWDAGLQKALIQTKESIEEAANVVFWTNLVLGIVIYALIFFTASLLAAFFKSPAAAPVLQILGLQVVIGSASTVQRGLMLRNFKFKLLFWARLSTVAIPAAIAIPMACGGYGVWALVTSSLVGSMINCLVLWLGSSWHPSFHLNTEVAKSMFRFGSWIVLDSLIGWFIRQGDKVALGRYLPVKDLGIYRTGSNLVDIAFGFVLNPILPILYPAFSAIHSEKRELINLFYKANKIAMSLALPVGAGIACVATPLVALVLGEKWKGVEIVLMGLGPQMAIGWLIAANPEVYRAVGRPDIQTKIGVVSVPLYVFMYFLIAPFGLTAFVLARLGLTLVILPLHVFVAVKLLNVSPFYLWKIGRPIILSTIIMVFSVRGLDWIFTKSLPSFSIAGELFLCTICGAFVYFCALWVMDRQFVLNTKVLIIRAITG